MWCFPILQNFSDICMDVTFPATPVQTKPNLWICFFWLRLLRHNLSRNNHTIVSQLMGLVVYIWRLITSAFEPHWRIHCKFCVKSPKHSPRNLLFPWNFFFYILFSRGIRNKQEHAISKKTKRNCAHKLPEHCTPKEEPSAFHRIFNCRLKWGICIFKLTPVKSAQFHSCVCPNTHFPPMYWKQHDPKLIYLRCLEGGQRKVVSK